MIQKILSFHARFREKLRYRVVAAVIETIEMSSMTREREEFSFTMWENGYGSRRFNVTGSNMASEYQAWRFSKFYKETATPWKIGDITTEELNIRIVNGVKKNDLPPRRNHP